MGGMVGLHSSIGPLFGDIESDLYLTQQIVTYLGNKRALLPFIEKALDHVCEKLGRTRLSLGDLFSGSGIVSRFFKRYASLLVANDLEDYARVINHCFLANRSEVDWEALETWHRKLLAALALGLSPGPITQAYAPKQDDKIEAGERVFYTRRNAMFLDTARRAIEAVPEPLRDFFLAPLLAEASVHSNTSGVFKGFYKDRQGIGCFGGEGRNALQRICGEVSLQLPYLSEFECPVKIFQEDTNALVRHLQPLDLIYLDPPYNQHPYGSNYFMLNLLVSGKEPEKVSRVSGIPEGWNRSRYNKRPEAADALFDLIEHCPSRFVLISYNSEGFVPYEMFLSNLQKMGTLTPFETRYNTFRGCRNLASRSMYTTEYLFLLEKHHGA